MITSYNLSQSSEWDELVSSFANYDVYYLSGYVRAFALHGDGEPLLLYYHSDDVRAINVVMKRDISEDKRFTDKIASGEYYDLSTPYGYGGWIFEGNPGKSFEDEYDIWCSDNNVVSEVVRFHPVLNNAQYAGNDIYERVLLGPTIAIKLDNEEDVWNRFSSKNRGHIRVAIKEGVTVKIDDSEEDFDIFKRIYKETMNHDEATDYYYFDDAFFESIRNDLKDKCKIFTAYLGDVAIASAIMIYASEYMNYHLSGQVFEYRRFSGTSMILYEASKWGIEHNSKWLHLGGGLGAKEGPLYDFKKSFYKKGEDKSFYLGKRIVDEEKYKYLLSLRDNVESSGFFPAYRA